MAYVAPSIVSTGDSVTSVAHNIIVNDILNHEDRIVSASMSGMVAAFAGSSAPTGWLLCDGAAVSRSTYAALWTALGTTSSPYGQGDGSSTFNTPNLKGRTVIGVGVGTEITGVLGTVQGAKEVTLSAAQSGLADHKHDMRVENQGGSGYPILYNFNDGVDGIVGHDGGSGTTGVGTESGSSFRWVIGVGGLAGGAAAAASAHTNIQPSMPLNYIIKY